MIAATHSGKFHADDVLAWALLLEFYSPNLQLIRTRDARRIENADIVFDVGGIFDPQQGRFDHHQSSYTGELSSAGMVLEWLFNQTHISEEIFRRLKSSIVDYVDDVDNGRFLPKPGIPCFAQLIDLLATGSQTLEDFDKAFQEATILTQSYIRSFQRQLQIELEHQSKVLQEMERSTKEKRNYLLFEQYITWKKPYFSNSGETHHSEFVFFPNLQNNWQALAIPPQEHSFAQKRSFPEEWSGLRNETLSDVVGIPGAIFCHKNRFIAVFESKDILFQSMRKWRLIS